jgi:hypothetical protein
MMGFAFDAVYQYWFDRRTLALNARFGGGFTVITGIYYDHAGASPSEPVGAVLPLMNGGLSFEWVFGRSLFAEAGLEYTQHFSSRPPAPGMLNFTAAIGWRF